MSLFQVMEKRKKNILLGILVLAATGISIYFMASGWFRAERIQKEIAKEVIRFHVLANSDSNEDQELKLKVKNVLVNYLQGQLSDTVNVQQAREIIKGQMEYLEQLAMKTMKQEGYEYGARAVLGEQNFPVKLYGDMAFPAGKYEALQISLGEGKGKNWWCVMFPALCMVDGTYSVVPQESKEMLKAVLNEEDYNALLYSNDTKVTVKWKTAEWWKNLVEYFTKSL